LIENGAKINAKNANGNTALMEASCFGHSDIIKFLIENGADSNTANNDGCQTDLSKKHANKQFKLFKFLLNKICI
jgi:ankyrin repeat protein